VCSTRPLRAVTPQGKIEDASGGTRDHMKRRAIKFVLAVGGLGLLSIIAASVLINRAAGSRTYSDVKSIPHRPVGLILGCAKVLPNGNANLFFRYRVAAAAELYRAGRVDYLLVSGDNHIHAYDEAKDMKNSLVEMGVPREKIYCDYAGFRTLDSVVRAREVFGQTQITVISQEFHNRRAIFIARHRGVDAIGFNAPAVDVYESFKTRCREQLAKVNTVLDIFLFRRQPKYFGPKVLIGPKPQPEPT
jgi:SanA protein